MRSCDIVGKHKLPEFLCHFVGWKQKSKIKCLPTTCTKSCSKNLFGFSLNWVLEKKQKRNGLFGRSFGNSIS